MKMKNKKGFTLIELLVVIAIIGLLSTLAVVSLNNARTKARDTKRMADLKAIQSAIELWKYDNSDTIFALPATWAALATTLVTYLPGGVPKDPGSNNYFICTYTTNKTYLLGAVLENIPAGAGSGGVTSSGWLVANCRDEDNTSPLAAAPACTPASVNFCLGSGTR